MVADLDVVVLGSGTAGQTLAHACAAGGLHVFGKREYSSNIKGEHSYFTVRVSEQPIRSALIAAAVGAAGAAGVGGARCRRSTRY